MQFSALQCRSCRACACSTKFDSETYPVNSREASTRELGVPSETRKPVEIEQRPNRNILGLEPQKHISSLANECNLDLAGLYINDNVD